MCSSKQLVDIVAVWRLDVWIGRTGGFVAVRS